MVQCEMLDKGVIHVISGTHDVERFHYTTQNGEQFKIYIVSGILHLIYPAYG
jgi:hypothetical protein